jgi:hypothetical protein
MPVRTLERGTPTIAAGKLRGSSEKSSPRVDVAQSRFGRANG